MIKKTLIYTLFFMLSGLLFSQPQTGNMLIKNGTIITVTKGTLTNTDIVIENGKITKIGKNLKAPKNAITVDATDMHVMPGIIDAHSHIAIDAVNEATNPVTAEVWVGDALNPMDVSIYRALAGGVTISHAMHGSANAIGGQCETIKHRWGTMNPEEIRMEGAPRTIKFALGENPIRVHGEGNRIMPATRMGVEQVIREAFEQGKQYKSDWDNYKMNVGKDATAVPPLYNLRSQTMSDIIDGKIIVHCHSYRADEILMLLDVLGDFGVKKICFQHVNEGFKIAPELAEYGAMASVFADWWAYKFEVYYSTAYNATILHKNGVVTSINSDSGELIRHLYHEAAKTQKYGGLSDDEALSLITINPAKQLGIADRVGSLEEGKEADIAIFKGHPLSVYAIPQKTIVDGVVKFDIENDMDDQRLLVDPEESIPMYYEAESHEDNCMHGIEEIFGLNELLFEHKH